METYQVVLLTIYCTINAITLIFMFCVDYEEVYWWHVPIVLGFGTCILIWYALLDVRNNIEYYFRMKKYRNL